MDNIVYQRVVVCRRAGCHPAGSQLEQPDQVFLDLAVFRSFAALIASEPIIRASLEVGRYHVIGAAQVRAWDDRAQALSVRKSHVSTLRPVVVHPCLRASVRSPHCTCTLTGYSGSQPYNCHRPPKGDPKRGIRKKNKCFSDLTCDGEVNVSDLLVGSPFSDPPFRIPLWGQ